MGLGSLDGLLSWMAASGMVDDLAAMPVVVGVRVAAMGDILIWFSEW